MNSTTPSRKLIQPTIQSVQNEAYAYLYTFRQLVRKSGRILASEMTLNTSKWKSETVEMKLRMSRRRFVKSVLRENTDSVVFRWIELKNFHYSHFLFPFSISHEFSDFSLSFLLLYVHNRQMGGGERLKIVSFFIYHVQLPICPFVLLVCS